MSLHLLILGIVIVTTAWVGGFLAVHSRRRLPRDALLVALAAFTATHIVILGLDLQLLDSSWEALGFAALVLAHAAVAGFAILFLYGDPVSRRAPVLLAILIPGLALAALGGPNGWRASEVFQPAIDAGHVVVNTYLIACLAVALAESFAAFRRSRLRRREALLLVAGTVALVVGGPVYAFELAVLGFAGLAGTNLAVPVAGALFSFALLLANPLPFHGTKSEKPAKVPWSIPKGVMLLEEVRPAYAEGAFLAAADGRSALAILGSPATKASLDGAEVVHLPPGYRCASVLEATASEFFARESNGVVLVYDLSYPVVHAGLPATAEALARCADAVPRDGTFLVSLTKLTDEERRTLREVPGTHLAPPDLQVEIRRVLETHLGVADEPLLQAARVLGKEPFDLSIPDLLPLGTAVVQSLQRMRDPADRAATAGWAQVSRRISGELEALYRTPPTERRPRAAGGRDASEVRIVRASDVLGAGSGAAAKPKPPIGPAVRQAFLGNLGSAGETVYARVVGRMRKDPDLLQPEDLPKVAALAEEAIADLGGVIDVESARRDLVERARRLRVSLATLAQEASG